MCQSVWDTTAYRATDGSPHPVYVSVRMWAASTAVAAATQQCKMMQRTDSESWRCEDESYSESNGQVRLATGPRLELTGHCAAAPLGHSQFSV